MTPLFAARWIYLCLLALALLGGLFWHDIAEQGGDDFHALVSSSLAETAVIGERDLAPKAAAEVRFELTRNDPAQIHVSEIRLESRSGARVVASARLSSRVAGNDYPHLVLSFEGPEGKPLRELELAPTEYEHGIALSDERVRFNLEIRDGERRLTARAKYLTDPVNALSSAAVVTATGGSGT